MDIKPIAQALQRRGWHLATAESATGGLLGAQITAVSGSSAYFWGGIIAYADDVKVKLLGVNQASLARWGAVSAPVALEMAQGARKALGVEVAVSITGIAGPTGATAYKPLGLYYVGLAVPGDTWVWHHRFEADRAGNNERAATAALTHLRRYLTGVS